MTWIKGLFCGFLLLAFGAAGAHGAEVAFQDITATPYTELTTLHASESQPSGAVEKYVAPTGSALWLITFRIVPTWDEATQRMEFDSQTFGFYLGNQKLEHIGGMQAFGVVESYYGGAYLSRPDEWKTAKEPGQWKRILVVVPNGKNEINLRAMRLIYNEQDMNAEPQKVPVSTTVKLGGAPKPFDVNDFVEIKVRSVKMLPSVEDKSEYDPMSRGKLIVNEGGSIMQLTLQITPKEANVLEAKEFRWSPAVIGLSFGKGGRAVCLGMRQYGTINTSYGDPIVKTDGDIWDSKTVSVYFPVPSNLKTFDITYLGHKVATGAVQ